MIRLDENTFKKGVKDIQNCVSSLTDALAGADMEVLQVAEAVAGVPTGSDILVYSIRDKDTGVVTYYDKDGNILVSGQDFVLQGASEALSTTEVRAVLEFDNATAHAQNIVTKTGATMTPSTNTDGSFIIPDGAEKFYIFVDGTVTIDGLEYTDYIENQEDSGSLNRATTIAFVSGQIATVLVTYQLK